MDNYIKSVEYHVIGKKTTICLITTYNGFEIVGTSACVNPKDFDKELGEKYALEDAKNNLGKHIGFYIGVVQFGYPYDTGVDK